MKTYHVTFDVFLMHHATVEAKNKKEAVAKARKDVSYGAGEEVKLYNIEVEE